MASDIAALKQVRKAFAGAAATCNKGAKAIVQATTEIIAARKGRGRGTLGKLLRRLR